MVLVNESHNTTIDSVNQNVETILWITHNIVKLMKLYAKKGEKIRIATNDHVDNFSHPKISIMKKLASYYNRMISTKYYWRFLYNY